MTRGVVREWHADHGWGVIESKETPGGCWAHFSNLDVEGYYAARPGQEVEFTYESGRQDDYDFRALSVRIDGVPPGSSHTQPPGPAYRSSLTFDSGD